MRLVGVDQDALAESLTDSLYRDPAGRGFLLPSVKARECFIRMGDRLKDVRDPRQREGPEIRLRTFEKRHWPPEPLDGGDEHDRWYPDRPACAQTAENSSSARSGTDRSGLRNGALCAGCRRKMKILLLRSASKCRSTGPAARVPDPEVQHLTEIALDF